MAAFGRVQYIKRFEDDRLLQGGPFTDNLSPPNQAYVMLVGAARAHARIVKIDSAAVRATPGVVGVVTWDDMANGRVQPFGFPAICSNADGERPDITSRRSAVFDLGDLLADVRETIYADSVHFYWAPNGKRTIASWPSASRPTWWQLGA